MSNKTDTTDLTMTDEQILQWINACNHEPARQTLRDYMVLRQSNVTKSTTDLVNRLRGHYRTPITDGLGPAGGEEPDNPLEHVRTFFTPPIQKEAADEIERLSIQLEAELKWRRDNDND